MKPMPEKSPAKLSLPKPQLPSVTGSLAKPPATRRITVQWGFRRGFDHSFSSVELNLTETIEIAPGDSVKAVRRAALDRIKAHVVAEVEAFKTEHDVPGAKDKR